MIEKHSPQWEPLNERLEFLMCGDFEPGTCLDANPRLPFDVICLVRRDFYEEQLKHKSATMEVPDLPTVHVCDTVKHGPLLLWEEFGGYSVRRIGNNAMRYLLDP